MVKKEDKKSPDKLKKGEAPSPRKWFYLILVLIPVLFIILLEVSLRIFDYGAEYKTFAHLSKAFPEKLFLNTGKMRKYFPNLEDTPGTIPDGFDEKKKENAFRVFVLGGSSTEGWPFVPNTSFPRYIKRRLELLYPDNKIEVINCGASAINTYTIRDIVPAIIEQQPDLILIYAGHNEYYGALGVGSSASMGTSRTLINTYIWLLQFRTVQLVRDFINWIRSLFINNEPEDSGDGSTLMEKMIGESEIPYKSDLYEAGIEQFEGNMDDILAMFKENKIPVIIGTLTSNLRGLKPFISVDDGNSPPAETVFEKAKKTLSQGDSIKAKELFIQAKDLDALRFRAPEKINKIITELAKKYNYALVPIDSIFNSASPYGITGYNLTVDHLHPNIKGYTLIGEKFFEKMESLGLMPEGKKINYSTAQQDSIMKAKLPFTPLDSTMSYMRLIMLIGNYPFTPKGAPNQLTKNYKMKDFNDSLSSQILRGVILWEVGHTKAAKVYYNRGDYKDYMREIDAIIEDRPYIADRYEYAAKMLVDADQASAAAKYIYPLHKLRPSYFTSKWIGQLELHKGNYKKALEYLEQAVKYRKTDWQTWYNLAGAYAYKNKFDEALEAVKKSLKLNPQNKLAQNFYRQLLSRNEGK